MDLYRKYFGFIPTRERINARKDAFYELHVDDENQADIEAIRRLCTSTSIQLRPLLSWVIFASRSALAWTTKYIHTTNLPASHHACKTISKGTNRSQGTRTNTCNHNDILTGLKIRVNYYYIICAFSTWWEDPHCSSLSSNPSLHSCPQHALLTSKRFSWTFQSGWAASCSSPSSRSSYGWVWPYAARKEGRDAACLFWW